MKIIRDEQGKIIQIVKEESDGDFNVVDVFKAEIDKEIAREKEITEREREITARQKNRCDFWKDSMDIANSIATTIINKFENGGENFSIQEPPPMPPYDDQEVNQ